MDNEPITCLCGNPDCYGDVIKPQRRSSHEPYAWTGGMKIFEVELVDSLRYKHLIHLEGVNAATLDLGLNATLGVAGCEIISVTEYIPADY